jgi:hypothetical protein
LGRGGGEFFPPDPHFLGGGAEFFSPGPNPLSAALLPTVLTLSMPPRVCGVLKLQYAHIDSCHLDDIENLLLVLSKFTNIFQNIFFYFTHYYYYYYFIDLTTLSIYLLYVGSSKIL